ncbi:hypothetical protein BDZ89DRAFT_1145129 [Hymenopellis radicata]|nr:hypothetical protein BDZ89DRAFT_1145129 [Hymenopellis radicata]
MSIPLSDDASAHSGSPTMDIDYNSDEDPKILSFSPYHGARKRIPPEVLDDLHVNLIPPSDTIHAERVLRSAPSSCYAHYFTINPGPEVLYCLGYIRPHYLNARKAGRHPEFYAKLEKFLAKNFEVPKNRTERKRYLQMIYFRLVTNRCLSAHESNITPPFFLLGYFLNEIAEEIDWRSNDTIWRELALLNHPDKVREILDQSQEQLDLQGLDGRQRIRPEGEDSQTVNEWRGAATTFLFNCEDFRTEIDTTFAAYSMPMDRSSHMEPGLKVVDILEKWEGLPTDNFVSVGPYHDDIADDYVEIQDAARDPEPTASSLAPVVPPAETVAAPTAAPVDVIQQIFASTIALIAVVKEWQQLVQHGEFEEIRRRRVVGVSRDRVRAGGSYTLVSEVDVRGSRDRRLVLLGPSGCWIRRSCGIARRLSNAAALASRACFLGCVMPSLSPDAPPPYDCNWRRTWSIESWIDSLVQLFFATLTLPPRTPYPSPPIRTVHGVFLKLPDSSPSSIDYLQITLNSRTTVLAIGIDGSRLVPIRGIVEPSHTRKDTFWNDGGYEVDVKGSRDRRLVLLGHVGMLDMAFWRYFQTSLETAPPPPPYPWSPSTEATIIGELDANARKESRVVGNLDDLNTQDSTGKINVFIDSVHTKDVQ